MLKAYVLAENKSLGPHPRWYCCSLESCSESNLLIAVSMTSPQSALHGVMLFYSFRLMVIKVELSFTHELKSQYTQRYAVMRCQSSSSCL